MRKFEGGPNKWDDKINFVDENDVAIGFDMGSSCCENFGWDFKKDPNKEETIELSDDDLKRYRFDTSVAEIDVNDGVDRDSGGAVAFKVINPDDEKDVVYLVFYNSHNGYYSHGYDVLKGGQSVGGGSL